ncbi:MAG TPA: serine hydrolase domain-containing protein [Thermoanaerobaculia bacterium]|nr:serine hydrolase domain-containing protein [Thermoanaerobaculia bacterium]
MKRSVVVTFLSLLLVLSAHGQVPEPEPDPLPPDPNSVGIGVKPRTCPDVVPEIPAECETPKDWPAATACLDAIVRMHPTLFPGAVIAYQPDGKPMNVYASGAGFTNNTVVSLASAGKPYSATAVVKLVQDHYASPACTPMTANCVFPQKFETRLVDALRVLDRLRGTDVVPRWFDRIVTDDAAQQRTWKNAIRIKHLAQMTSGYAPMGLTGYRFCPGGVCPPETGPNDVTCNPDAPGPCRHELLYTQYLTRRGGERPIPNGCRPLTLGGPRLFDFKTYYNGRVDAPYRLLRQFERRYTREPGLFGECVLLEDSIGPRWVDGRTATESEIAKFYLGSPLLSAPGTVYYYAQQNVYLTAFLIEAVSGQRFDDYAKAQLFTPLGMTDTSFVVRPGTPQYQRLADIKRIPTTPARVLPDIAAPLRLDTIYGADKNWDEPLEGWRDRWPEGGAKTSAGDVLRFLRFIRTGKAPDGRVILNAESLRLVTTETGPVSPRTYAFNSSAPGVIFANGYFGTLMLRDANRCFNMTLLPQIITENPDLDVQLCDYQYGDVTRLRSAVGRMIAGIATACDAAAPAEP